MRNLGLDILRFFAVLLVLGRHMLPPPEGNAFLRFWQTGGWIGVDLFFVLSGFLVSGLLFKEYLINGEVDLKRFLIRRGFKIYPAFYAFLIITILIKEINGKQLPVNEVLGEIFFLQNYLGGLWNHTWSLAVEEHFYIALVLLCYVLLSRVKTQLGSKDSFHLIPRIVLIVCLGCLILRIGNLLLFESYSHKWFLFVTHIRIDSLMFGVFISYLWYFHNLKSKIKGVNTMVLLGVGILLLSPAFIFPLEHYKLVSVLGVVLFYLGSGVFVLAAIRLTSSYNKALLLCGKIGVASYSIYLWHMAINGCSSSFVTKVLHLDNYYYYFSFYIFFSIIFGCIMGKILELPILKMRDRLFSSKIK